MNKDNAIGLGIGLLAGAAIGGIIALLYAPKTGKEARQLIQDKATDVVDEVKAKANGAVQAIRS